MSERKEHYLLRWFTWKHLPDHLKPTSIKFRGLAEMIDQTIPDGAEKTTALRKLLEAKDAAVRAVIEGRDKG